MNRSPEEMREHFLGMKAELGNIRERIKSSPALDSLRETQQLQLEVVQEQLRMKQALIERLKNATVDVRDLFFDQFTDDLAGQRRKIGSNGNLMKRSCQFPTACILRKTQKNYQIGKNLIILFLKNKRKELYLMIFPGAGKTLSDFSNNSRVTPSGV